MQQQNEDDEKLKSKTMSGDGTRWKGASKKKGSVTSYAKDVQEKLKKQSMRDPSKKATAAARRTQRKLNESQYAFNNKGFIYCCAVVVCFTSSPSNFDDVGG